MYLVLNLEFMKTITNWTSTVLECVFLILKTPYIMSVVVLLKFGFLACSIRMGGSS